MLIQEQIEQFLCKINRKHLLLIAVGRIHNTRLLWTAFILFVQCLLNISIINVIAFGSYCRANMV